MFNYQYYFFGKLIKSSFSIIANIIYCNFYEYCILFNLIVRVFYYNYNNKTLFNYYKIYNINLIFM